MPAVPTKWNSGLTSVGRVKPKFTTRCARSLLAVIPDVGVSGDNPCNRGLLVRKTGVVLVDAILAQNLFRDGTEHAARDWPQKAAVAFNCA